MDGDPNRTAINWAERGSLPFEVADERRAMKTIAGADFIIIDTPARPHTDDLKELSSGCDLLILPTIPDILSLQPMLEIARDLGDAHYRALLTVVPPKPNKEGKTIRQELIDGGLPVFKTMIRRTVGFPKAALAGVPIGELPDSRLRIAWQDYQKLGKEVEGILS